jgi:hypothetical protein
LFAAVALVMLLVIVALIVPRARRNNISTPHAIELVLLMWLCSLFAAWALTHSRRRRHRDGSGPQFSTYTDYSDSLHNDSDPGTPADTSGSKF